MKQKYLTTIGQYFFYLLLAISVVLTVTFYLNTGNINVDEPVVAKRVADMGSILNLFFYWIYIVAVIAVILAIGFPLINIVSNPKKGLKTLISIAIIVVLLFVAYQFADGTLLNIPGYDGPDNIPSRLKMTDTIIFSVYAMFVVAIISVLYAEISKLFK